MSLLDVSPEVADALASGRAVVALETSVVAHGLPPPHNLAAARRCAEEVRAAGAVPAAIAVVRGRLRVGASDDELARLADPGTRAAKAGARDLAAVLAAGGDAGTTVSATAAVAARAGIRVFATGGIGGVHRVPEGAPPVAAGDVSADLLELARRRVCVVSSGPKAILDVPATAEALETLGVPVAGFGTDELPAFYTDGSGVALAHRLDSAEDVARWLRILWDGLGAEGGALLAVPPPEPVEREVVEAAVGAALAEARRQGVTGQAVTPFLLDAVARATRGRAREANLVLLARNARVAGEVAAALARIG